jgi:GWxTD domain-containing protein
MGPINRSGVFVAGLATLLACSTLSTSQVQLASGSQKAGALKLDGGVPYYKGWLQQDVIWIITDDERVAFKRLQNDQERDQFIEAFWGRRNPTPDSFDNPYKDEHYRRIVYANDHFGTLIPGWKSDRGRMYIMYGPPEEIESYATRSQDKTPDVDPSSYPLEVWHYRHIEGIGEDVVLEFVDACKCGEYAMPMTLVRDKDARSQPAKGSDSLGDSKTEPNNLHLYVGPANPPKVKYKNLEEKANSGLNFKTLPFDVTVDVVKATDVTSLVPITISFRSLHTTVDEKGVRWATVNIFGRVITLTGRVADVFETTLTIGTESGASSAPSAVIKSLALPNGRYKFEVVAQEANGDRWATWAQGVKVP